MRRFIYFGLMTSTLLLFISTLALAAPPTQPVNAKQTAAQAQEDLLVGAPLAEQLQALQPVEQEPVTRYTGEVVIRATLRNAKDLMLINQLSDDPWSHAPGIGTPSDWRLPRSALPTLRGAGVPFDIFIPDVDALVQAERERLAQPMEAADWFADFKNLAAINARLDALVAAHPATCKIVTAGISIQGRSIKGIRISHHPDGTAIPGFVFTATQHAREWAVPMAAMWYADRLAEDDGIDSRITAILDASEVIIFPVINPDGYEYSWTTTRLWRKNRRLVSGSTYGVDLNRNWATGWGGAGSSGTASSETYRGTAAFSEPESAGFRDFMLPRTNTAGHIDMHSYSQILMWPYSYTASLPPESATYTRVSGLMGTAMKAAYNTNYTVGNSWAVYGATAGCIEDWTSTVVGCMGWCVEVRDTGSYGFVMPASAIIPNATENFAGAKVMMEEVLKACTINLITGPSTSIAAGATSPVRVTVTANVGSLIASGAVRLKWKIDNGTTQNANMVIASGQWGATLPAINCGQALQWWVEAETNFTTTRWPLNLPTSSRTSLANPCANPADLDGSNTVDSADIGLLLLDFGVCSVPSNCPADLDHSGEVDSSDIGIMLLEF